jgi:hypothetical protein
MNKELMVVALDNQSVANLDVVELSLAEVETVGGGDATSYPIGPRS